MKTLKCIKTFTTFMNFENLINNGYSPEDAAKYDSGELSFPLFVEGKEYKIIGPLDTLSDEVIIYVDSILKLKHNNQYISELFYVNEFNDEKVKEFEENIKKYKDTPFEKMVSEIEKPRNERFIGEYFEYK